MVGASDFRPITAGFKSNQAGGCWLFLPLLLLVAVATPCFTGQKAIELIMIRDCTPSFGMHVLEIMMIHD